MGVLARDVFGCEDSFFFGLVGQHRSADYITDCEDVWCGGLQVVVDDDSASLVDLHARLLEAQLLSVRLPSS